MLRGMAQMDLNRRLNANRTLSVTMSFLALVGWGAFAYAAGSSVSTERQLRNELTQSTATHDQLRAERKQQQAAVGDLAQIQAKLASAREDLDILAHEREQATAQVAAVRQDLVVLTKRRNEKQAKVSEKGSVRGAKPSSKPAQIAAQGKDEKASEKIGAQVAKPPSKPARLAARTKHDV
jgi:Tfp pilus assembly protein PilO